MSNESSQMILALRPLESRMIMDVVGEAGVDISRWSFKANGDPVRNPRANPNYCYEWSFGGNGEPIALCIWHESLDTAEENIVYADNLRRRAMSLESITFDQRAPREDRHRAKDQARRARNFDQLVQQAYRKNLPMRAVLLEGDRAADGVLGRDSSKVKHRLLDPINWHVENYDDGTGAFVLARGDRPVVANLGPIPIDPVSVTVPHQEVGMLAIPEAHPDEPAFVDQFSIPEGPLKILSVRDGYVRSAEVRRKVLDRAGGVCECCGERGFVTTTGQVFLETHHVISLGEGGPDKVWNVIAICPNDHRRVHFAEGRAGLRMRMLDVLEKYHPVEIARIKIVYGAE
jgi:5-methylcytosine-specific restriction protein A